MFTNGLIFELLLWYVEDPEPLYTLRMRMQHINAISRLNKDTHAMVRSKIYPLMVERFVRTEHADVPRNFLKNSIRSMTDYAFMTDQQVADLERFVYHGYGAANVIPGNPVTRIKSILNICKCVEYSHLVAIRLEMKALYREIITPQEIKTRYKLTPKHITELVTYGCRTRCSLRQKTGFPKVVCDELALRVHGSQQAISLLHHKAEVKRARLQRSRQLRATRMDQILQEGVGYKLLRSPCNITTEQVIKSHPCVGNIVSRYVSLGKQTHFDHAMILIQREFFSIKRCDEALTVRVENMPVFLHDWYIQYLLNKDKNTHTSLVRAYDKWMICLSNIQHWAPMWYASCDSDQRRFHDLLQNSFLVQTRIRDYIYTDNVGPLQNFFVSLDIEFARLRHYNALLDYGDDSIHYIHYDAWAPSMNLCHAKTLAHHNNMVSCAIVVMHTLQSELDLQGELANITDMCNVVAYECKRISDITRIVVDLYRQPYNDVGA
jgi:hypothetical protein